MVCVQHSFSVLVIGVMNLLIHIFQIVVLRKCHALPLLRRVFRVQTKILLNMGIGGVAIPEGETCTQTVALWDETAVTC